jgi:hypothetical protein
MTAALPSAKTDPTPTIKSVRAIPKNFFAILTLLPERDYDFTLRNTGRVFLIFIIQYEDPKDNPNVARTITGRKSANGYFAGVQSSSAVSGTTESSFLFFCEM